MNIVVLDSDNLAGEADFPEIDYPKFGWLQYVESKPDQMEDRCWRSDIIVSVSTRIDRAVMEKAYKLRLIVVAGHSYDHIDLDTAMERGIKVSNVPGSDPVATGDTKLICQQVVANINAFLLGRDRNMVGN